MTSRLVVPSFQYLHLWQESMVRYQLEQMCPDQWLKTNTFGPDNERLLYTQMSKCPPVTSQEQDYVISGLR